MQTILTVLGLMLILGIIFWLIDFVFSLSSVGWSSLLRRIFKNKN